MRTSICRPEELGPAEIERWRSFNRSTPGLESPFLRPEFAVAVGRRRHDARVAVLEDPSGVIQGFFGFQRTSAGVGHPLGRGLSDYQGVVHAPGVTWSGRDLLAGCGLAVWEFTHLVEAQAELFAPHPLERHPSPTIDLRDGADAWFARRASSRLKRVRTYERKLVREVGEVRFELDSRDPAQLERLMSWKSAQYVRTGRRDRFAQPWFVAAVREMVASPDDGFSAPVSTLSVDGRVVALNLALRADHVLAYWFPTYDPDCAHYSPGLIQLLRIVRAAAECGVTSFDLGAGEAAYKESFRDVDQVVCSGAVRRRTPTAAARWLRTEPVRAGTNFVLARPRLRLAARRTLAGVGQLRAQLR